jgi:hypothetical protein
MIRPAWGVAAAIVAMSWPVGGQTQETGFLNRQVPRLAYQTLIDPPSADARR